MAHADRTSGDQIKLEAEETSARASDMRGPVFIAEAARRAGILRGRPEERDALDFIDAAFEWPAS
jgi:hypothetical protein